MKKEPYKNQAKLMDTLAGQALKMLSKAGKDPVTMSDQEILRYRGIGRGTLATIRKLTGSGKPTCPHCGMEIAGPRTARPTAKQFPWERLHRAEQKAQLLDEAIKLLSSNKQTTSSRRRPGSRNKRTSRRNAATSSKRREP